MKLLLAVLIVIPGLAQPGPSSPIFPGSPPGGIGGPCVQVPVGYITAAGQYVSCIAGLWAAGGGSAPSPTNAVVPFGPIHITQAQLENLNNAAITMVSAAGANTWIVPVSLRVEPICGGCTLPTLYDAEATQFTLTYAGSIGRQITEIPCQASQVIVADPGLFCDVPAKLDSDLSTFYIGSALINKDLVFSVSYDGLPARGKPLTFTVGTTPGTGYTTDELVDVNTGAGFAYATITQSGGVPSALTAAYPPVGYTMLNYAVGAAPGTNFSTASQPSALSVTAGGTGYAVNDTGVLGVGQCGSPGAYKVTAETGGVVSTVQILWQPTGCNGIGVLMTSPDGPQPGGGDSALTLTETDSTDSGTLTANLTSVQWAAIDHTTGPSLWVSGTYTQVTTH
ncbi:MAG TPA: hypothetical protein VJQ82_02605 [Terriglobales bacterium]|nr:hypothetical protein [Terriglobales bacterium]